MIEMIAEMLERKHAACDRLCCVLPGRLSEKK